MAIDPSTTLAKHASVTFRRLAEGEGGVLLHLESGEYHGINEVGCIIWELLDGERTVQRLVAAVADRVEDPPTDLDEQVIAFLESLHQRGLVT